MKAKKLLAILLVLAMTMVGFGNASFAEAATSKTYIQVEDNSALSWDFTPGTTKSITIPISAAICYIYNPTITVKADEDCPFLFSAPKLSTDRLPLGTFAIETSGETYVNIDVTVKENAKIGKYPFDVNFEFKAQVESGDGISESVIEDKFTVMGYIAKEKAASQLAISNLKYNEDSAAIGNTVDVSFDVTNEGEITALNTYVSVDYAETGIVAGYSAEKIKVGDLKAGEKKHMTVTMKVLATATDGMKKLKASFSYKDPEGASYTDSKDFYVTIKKTSTQASEDAKLVITSNNTNNEVNAGSDFNLKGTIKNVGKKKATNVEVTILGGTGVTTGIIPNFDAQVLTLDDVASNKNTSFVLPLLVTESASAGLTELTVQVSYTDSEGNTKTTVTPFYVTVIKKEETAEDSDVVITNVSQSPAEPLVGNQVTVTFDVENRGSKAINKVSVGGEGLDTSGFEPFTAQAYKEIGSIEANSKKTVSLSFKVSDKAAEGLNTLTIGCKYEDNNGKKQAVSTPIYILDVINDSNSKPKIIVSDFGKDSEELKAGSTFVFSYTLKNTHQTKVAKNIKVTISQADNVFTATQGTNTAYLERIEPGEEVQNQLEMKVKSDVTTGSYELEIKVEYEYDNMSKVDQEAGGVTEKNNIKLQAIENVRPSIEEVTVGDYGENPYVNESTTMSFSAINKGKSPLNNVSFRLEGDFRLESGNSFYQGTIQSGIPEFIQLSVITDKTGVCGGTIIMTFEDSNGEQVEYRSEYTDIMVGEIMDMSGYPDDFMGGDMPIYNEGMEEPAKKDIMPVWLFILIQVAILAIVIPVVRIIKINIYKKKHRDDVEEL